MVIDTASWSIERVDVFELSLDTKNVRLRSVEPYESDILRYLFEYEDVIELANDIVRSGYFENDLPIVTEEDGKLVVLEGNRRIAALKGIANPTSVPRFKQPLERLRALLTDEALEDLLSIRVMKAPDRESTQPILASLHTRNPKKSWPRDQQAAFYYNQLTPGTTIKDLQERYPAVANMIPRFIRMREMSELVRRADLGDPTLKDFASSKNFKITVFERLYASPVFREKLGVSFGDDERAQVTGQQSDINRVLSRVVQDMKTGFLNTRRLERQDSQEFKDYLDSLTFERPSHQKDGNAAETSSSGETSNTTERAGNGTGPRPNKWKLDMAGIDCRLRSPGLARRFNELRKINCVELPNATMDLLRTVLECALKQYFIEVGDPVPRQGNRPIRLADAMDHAHKYFSGAGNKSLTSVVASLKTEKPQNEIQYNHSAEALNAVNHNPDVFFETANVRAAWAKAYPLMRVLLAGVETDQEKS